MRRKFLMAGTALAGVALIGLVTAWVLRKDIARGYADKEMLRRGVQARYDITAIGPSKQRLEHIVIGDPAHPDLTADWAEIETHTGLFRISVSRVRAGGVRLQGALKDGTVHFGEVDKLLPAPTDKPFVLPDIDVDLQDARLRLDTPYGAVGARVDGKGNVANSFAGQVAAVMPSASLGDCNASQATAYLSLKTQSRRISALGPLRSDAATCKGVALASSNTLIDLVTDEGLRRVIGTANLALNGVSNRAVSAKLVKSDTRFEWDGAQLRSDIRFASQGLVPGKGYLENLARLPLRAGATPIAPVGEQLATAIKRLGSGSAVSGRVAVVGGTGRGEATFDQVVGKSVSGAILQQQPRTTLRLNWPSTNAEVDGKFLLEGGGFPKTLLSLRGDGGRFAGVADIAAMAVGDTRLALAPVRFAYDRGGTSIDTRADLDGRFAGGRVSGLRIPVQIRGGKLIGECFPVGFQSYAITSLVLAPATLNICLRGGRASVATPRLNGRLGQNPVTLTAASAQLETNSGAFVLDRVAVKLGDAQRLSTLDLDQLRGAFAKGVANGTFAGGSGQIGNVPLLVSQGAGKWRFAKSILNVAGVVEIADAAAAPRFQPIKGEDLTLTLADGKITARTVLHEPKSGIAIANVNLAHLLSNGRGNALIDVPKLTFDDKLQPEALTTNTLGVIANVFGTISGKGLINWTPDGATSSGGFRTDNLDFAAAFGPVTGLKGEIALSDLLGLETPGGQSVLIGSINPGIPVTGGEVRYRLIPGLKIAIEGGHWPFAGGELILEPTVLDLNHAATRRLTFRVVGLDAALFVQQMAFENINVTGKFDGVLPMVFDETGGRIENGSLKVRDEGGTLSYIGEVSNAKLGRFSRLAFDALKSIRYKRLTLDLNGSLDGEMVTVVRFNGVNQLPLAQTKNIFLKQFNRIPFIFNITIKAPFRGLFATVRSLNDPSVFLPTVLPPQLQQVIPDKPVQPKESEPVR